MKVILAGYSLDADVIEELKDAVFTGDRLDPITPETISAAYARISRDPRPVTELREEARKSVAKAKKSNEAIVFGMGHHSVAEHVQLNFDILGISRLAIEALEESRLCAYTEKSQRYITLDGDFVVPKEIENIPEIKKEFLSILEKQNNLYNKAVRKLNNYHINKIKHLTYGMPECDLDKKTLDACEGRAKEDARYILSMATEGQLGFSANARNLEYIIRKLRYHPLEEVRDLSKQLYEIGSQIVPSLIVLSDPDQFKKQFNRKISDTFIKNNKAKIRSIFDKNKIDLNNFEEDECIPSFIKLVNYTESPDETIVTSLLHSISGLSYFTCEDRIFHMEEEGELKKLMLDLLSDLNEYDALYREFEHVTFTFALNVSSSAFAQWKRHRMATITKQGYRPILGYVYPKAVIKAGLQEEFKSLYEETSQFWDKLRNFIDVEEVAEYVLTNGHKRRIIITANLRELYHIARLRMDGHAQWEIRDQAKEIIALVKEKAPVAAMLACGKDQFNNLKNSL